MHFVFSEMFSNFRKLLFQAMFSQPVRNSWLLLEQIYRLLSIYWLVDLVFLVKRAILSKRASLMIPLSFRWRIWLETKLNFLQLLSSHFVSVQLDYPETLSRIQLLIFPVVVNNCICKEVQGIATSVSEVMLWWLGQVLLQVTFVLPLSWWLHV